MDLSDAQWAELGETLKRIHHVKLPYCVEATCVTRPSLTTGVNACGITSGSRGRLFGRCLCPPCRSDAGRAFGRRRTASSREVLADEMRSRSSTFVLCHADLHGGNILIDAQGRLFIVDWNT